jgi:hypothetical protein
MNGGPGTGWNSTPHAEAFQFSEHLASHVTGFTKGNLLTLTIRPFDPVTWAATTTLPGTTSVPETIRELPVRFAFTPAIGYPLQRRDATGVGATDPAYKTQ